MGFKRITLEGSFLMEIKLGFDGKKYYFLQPVQNWISLVTGKCRQMRVVDFIKEIGWNPYKCKKKDLQDIIL